MSGPTEVGANWPFGRASTYVDADESWGGGADEALTGQFHTLAQLFFSEARQVRSAGWPACWSSRRSCLHRASGYGSIGPAVAVQDCDAVLLTVVNTTV